MDDKRIGSRAALHVPGPAGGTPLGRASTKGWRPGQGQNVKIELPRRILPWILRCRRSGVSNNASNTTLNITRVMTTPLYALDNSKEPK